MVQASTLPGHRTSVTTSAVGQASTLPGHRTSVTASTKAPPLPSTGSTDEDDALPDGWKQYRTPDGIPYYYNENTKQSSWSKPAIPKAKVLLLCFVE